LSVKQGASDAARKRVAVEVMAQHEGALRHTARRYSLCEADADDAYQRALEILLTKAPSDDLRELIRWTKTVVKHEALSVRRSRERHLSNPAPKAVEQDWVALIPAVGSDPAERVERREAIARSREALQSLKPQELRALTLLAEGYTYVEISEMTGYSSTKINRCLAEGRERFRRTLASSDSGDRCEQMRPLLSAFCDGETSANEGRALREHLRACAGCRSTLRAYRAAPGAAAALAPALPATRSLLERAHDALAGLHARLPGQGGSAADSAISQAAAAGGSRGAGMAALAKVLAICVGTAGGAVACVATGVVPTPGGLGADHLKRPTLEKPSARIVDELTDSDTAVPYEPAPVEPSPPAKEPPPKAAPPAAPSPDPAPVATGAVEYTPEAAPAASPSPAPSANSSSGSAAGEFGP